MEGEEQQQTQWSLDNRDLLIELRTQMKALSQDLKEIKESTTTSVRSHEVRLRILETNMIRVQTIGGIGIILLGVIEFLLKYFRK